jgi:diguanylate cyclase (GGDEF)-like protein
MALLVIGILTGYMSLLNDRVARQARELEHRATHDFLTDLPNRALFYRRLDEALARGTAAVLFLDLDDFKLINDSLGHETGDRLLVRVAERVRGSVRQGETVSRLGGDEFTVLVEDVSEPDRAEEVASRILESLREPFEIDSRELRVTGSVGVSVGSPGMQSPESLLGAADSAMYDAKARGKAGYRGSRSRSRPGPLASTMGRGLPQATRLCGTLRDPGRALPASGPPGRSHPVCAARSGPPFQRRVACAASLARTGSSAHTLGWCHRR